nr:Ankyrin repeat and protein kinase domain-containing protein 1 [Ipomoea batatas]
MGCFTACFRRHSKHKRIINSHNNNNNDAPSRNLCLQSLLHSHDDDDVSEAIIKEAQTLDSIKPIAISKDEEEEELNRSSRKKVTFDLSVKTYEECSNQEEQKKGGENEAEKSLASYPLNHRYQNCSTNGEDEEDLGLEDEGWVQEESSESLFSLSIESRKSVSQPEMPDKEEVSSSPLNPFQKDPKTISGLNQFAQSVLNPIENMSHWKTAKAKTPLQQQQQEGEEKENQNLDWKSKGREIIAVDTSLSSWLVGSEKKKTPNSKNSPESVGNSPSDQRRNSAEDKPVLGDWSHQELKAVSKSSSPRCSSDEMPILGTVGSYWKHTGQATDSDSGSSCRGVSGESKGTRRTINQIPTPFQTRLETAVQDGKINAASNA